MHREFFICFWISAAFAFWGTAESNPPPGDHVWDEDDFYAILEISPEADEPAIKRAYRKMSLRFHPDKSGGNQQKFTKIARAYEVLMDPAKRRAYDLNGEEGVESVEHPKGDPFGGIFGQMFGFESASAGPKRMAAIELELPVTLEDIYNGRIVTASGYRQGICKKCRGTGAHTKKDIKICPKCEGRGVIVRMMQIHPGMYQQIQQGCNSCGGKGKIIGKKCAFCAGTRISDTRVSYRVTIEKGAAEGTKIAFPHATDETPEAVSGDVVFRLATRKHDRFARVGDDLHTTVTLSLKEALLGFKRTLKQLDGRLIVLKRTDVVTPPGHKERTMGEGMPKGVGEFGDLIVTYQVEFPKELTPQQREAVKLAGL